MEKYNCELNNKMFILKIYNDINLNFHDLGDSLRTTKLCQNQYTHLRLHAYESFEFVGDIPRILILIVSFR